MKPPISHVQINVSDHKAMQFYKDLLVYLGYSAIDEWGTGFGMEKHGLSLWIFVADEKYQKSKFHRKNVGLNHIAFTAEKKADVDKFVEEFLKPRNIPTLYNSPKEFPEYTKDYYAVFFEDLDRIKLEVAFHS